MSEIRVLDYEITGKTAWRGENLSVDDGCFKLLPECLEELDALVSELNKNPLQLHSLRPDDFELSACRTLMHQAREVLDEGLGFCSD
jgi:hypothetical protein